MFKNRKTMENLPRITQALLDIARIKPDEEPKLKETRLVAYGGNVSPGGRSASFEIKNGVPVNNSYVKQYSDMEQLKALQNQPDGYIMSRSEMYEHIWDDLLTSTGALLRINDYRNKIPEGRGLRRYGRKVTGFLKAAVSFATDVAGEKHYYGLIKGTGRFPDPKDHSAKAIIERLHAEDIYLPHIVRADTRTAQEMRQHVLDHAESYSVLLPYAHGRTKRLIKEALRNADA